MDIFPTLCELARIEKPAHLEGLSFKPIIENPKLTWKKGAFSQYLCDWVNEDGKFVTGVYRGKTLKTPSYRFTQWHYAEKPDSITALELYDHEIDPGETQNVAYLPEYRDVVKEHQDLLRRGWPAAGPVSEPKD